MTGLPSCLRRDRKHQGISKAIDPDILIFRNSSKNCADNQTYYFLDLQTVYKKLVNELTGQSRNINYNGLSTKSS